MGKPKPEACLTCKYRFDSTICSKCVRGIFKRDFYEPEKKKPKIYVVGQ